MAYIEKNSRIEIEEDKKFLAAFTKIPKLGPVRICALIKGFQSLKKAWYAERDEFLSLGIDEKIAGIIIDERKNIQPDMEMEVLEKEKIALLSISDKNYPRLLKEIYNPPPILFYRGTIENNDITLGVVGTRKISSYGKSVTQDLVYKLAQYGMTIVSGLALGVDALAHETTLEAGGKTIAVLGGGIEKNNIYPISNRNLAERIIESGGAIVSEYPCGTLPLKIHFPQRNRLISGLGLGTLVIEAPESSGALITAKFALEQNREVFAVPGGIFNQNSRGTNSLIKEGAHPVTCAEDIIKELHIEKAAATKISSGTISLSEEEAGLVRTLEKEPMHIDSIIRESKIPAAKINSILALLEIKGAVRNLGGGMYCKI